MKLEGSALGVTFDPASNEWTWNHACLLKVPPNVNKHEIKVHFKKFTESKKTYRDEVTKIVKKTFRKKSKSLLESFFKEVLSVAGLELV